MVTELLMGLSIVALCFSISFGLVSWMHIGMEDHKDFCTFNAYASCFFSCIAIVLLSSYVYLV